jgi:membrane protease YdiL (CAAX protease family)
VVNFVAAFADALWILGLAALLATISFAEYRRSRIDAPSQRQPLDAGALLLPTSLSLALIAIGLFLGQWSASPRAAAWVLLAAGISSALSIVLLFSAVRHPRRATAELATPGRPTL